ncbi:NnrS family protein [Microvirga brassicacearum]|uniref:NnrS family protein n=1 Tax=Microvirga brassicacearum TaxID=2580413 RepID=A0A5N3PAR9_9HYPH|nr:NnrS family protein [Microvirga brassicacearum]KAB0266842.1 NnrS family protein [Microvirga brassicacearum]
MAPIPRLRDYSGPALLSYGFRPFFLFGSLYAGLAILVWLPVFYGELGVPTVFVPRDWHIHEMLYGYLAAVITGFLLTTIPNWTGRLPIQGIPLLLLVVVWLAGRIAVTTSAWTGWTFAAIVDVSFLLIIALAAAREIITGKNWRNLKILVVLGLLLFGNIVFHLEIRYYGSADYSIRLAIGAIMMLIMLIGGRVIPSFTRNWLVRANPGRLPVPFGTFDTTSLVIAGVALLAWIALPQGRITGAFLLIAALLQTRRLARWAGDRTWRDRLVLVLHVAYAFVPLGFGLVGLASFGFIPASAGIHAWTGGAMGLMTLAIMSRASLGHTGRALAASGVTQVLYLMVIVGALARICAALEPGWSAPLLHIAGISWALAFVGFAVIYWSVLTRPRVVAEKG